MCGFDFVCVGFLFGQVFEIIWVFSVYLMILLGEIEVEIFGVVFMMYVMMGDGGELIQDGYLCLIVRKDFIVVMGQCIFEDYDCQYNVECQIVGWD